MQKNPPAEAGEFHILVDQALTLLLRAALLLPGLIFATHELLFLRRNFLAKTMR